MSRTRTTKDADIRRMHPFRYLVSDALAYGKTRNHMFGLVEVDVTEARKRIDEYEEKTGIETSFTAYILSCVGKTIRKHKQVHSMVDWRGRMFMFHQVDILILVNTPINGIEHPMIHMVRNCESRTVADIHNEIRRTMRKKKSHTGFNYFKWAWLLTVIPGFIRRRAYDIMLSFPHLAKRRMGTIMLTAVGMYGKGGGYGLTWPPHNHGMMVGGIEKRMDEHGHPRELLQLTLAFNHDIIDGAPATRYANALREELESAEGLRNLAKDFEPFDDEDD